MNAHNQKVRTRCRAKLLVILVLTLSALLPSATRAQIPVVSCENLARQALPNTTINSVRSYEAGEFQLPAGTQLNWFKNIDTSTPAFCRLTATLRPTSDSEIHIEVWLPASSWNGRLWGAGGLGWSGSILYEGLIEGLQHGYAAATSDAGHDASKDGGGGKFVIGHPEKLIDYTYRANHEMTVVAKALIKTYYGKPASHSYWFGCSLGGMQGFNEARLYPEDYDGIVVSGAGNPFANINAAQIHGSWLIAKKPERAIPAAKFKMMHEAIINACDELDGVKDGVIEDPRLCHWKPEEIQCKGADADNCLTAPQVELAQMIYAGTFNPRTGKLIFPGPARGAELTLPFFANPNLKSSPALDLYRYVVFQDPNWDFRTLDYGKDVTYAIQKVGPLFHTEPAQLKNFIDRGGKLIIWDGWNDFNSPYHWMDYRKDLVKLYGEEKVSNSVRMFFMPGMEHCIGGEGCDYFDRAATIEKWVEQGNAPDIVLAKKLEVGKQVRTRLMCVYPYMDKYKGKGDTNDAANWECVKGEL